LGAGGNIFVNLEGREPSGIVEPGPPYEELRQKLIDDLMTLSDPDTDQPIVERVHRREELYHGPHLDQAPDLIIQWKDYACWGRGRYESNGPVFQAQDQFDFSDQPLTGSHRLHGVLIAQGPGIQPGARLEGARLVDLAPTILGLLNVPAGDRLDGHVLEAIVSTREESSGESPTEDPYDIFGPDEKVGYSAEETEKISERLRSLGYL
jgi:predicted AlkP superfamily phosphohydrolase/phosphomutase